MNADPKHVLMSKDFPLSNKYDPRWIIENQMGLNPLWLTEWLCTEMRLQPGMRVLDLGCGRGLSSVFLAKEYDLQVWAADLWIKPTENYHRFQQAGVSDRVFPVHSDARELPFAEAFFDAILCIDAYIYFGTDDLYLDYLQRFVAPGGRIGIVVPGFMKEINGYLPEHLEPFWAQECWTWHTAAWWQWLWSRTELVEIEVIDTLPEGWRHWLNWKQALAASGDNRESLRSDIRVLESDQGKYMGFLRMIANRKQPS